MPRPLLVSAARLLGLVLVFAPALSGTARAEDPFESIEIPASGRTIMAELADLDGDGRSDLVSIVLEGLPPTERRLIRVHLQSDAGGIPQTPTFERTMPPGAAAYDLADLRPEGGVELILLRQGGVTVVSLASADAPVWKMDIDGRGTIGAAMDERGIERLHLVRHEFGGRGLLVVPRLTDVVVLSPDGEQLAALETGARANYFVPRQPSVMFVESDIQLFLDAPRILVGDVQGDGLADVVTASRHELRVFLRRPESEGPAFPAQPDRVLGLNLLSTKDHIRGSGGVSVTLRDWNGDGLADLLVTHVAGSFADATAVSRAYRNLGDGWNLDEPLSTHTSEGTLGADQIVDVDGDGQVELLRGGIPFSVLEFVEALVTQSIDANLKVYKLAENGGFQEDDWASVKIGIPISFDTFRTSGFVPTMHTDLNGDGALDLLLSGGGESLEIFLGAKEDLWGRRNERQKFDSEGQLRLGDIDGDGLQDLLVFDAMTPNATIRLGRNRGVLPGTKPQLSSRPEK